MMLLAATQSFSDSSRHSQNGEAREQTTTYPKTKSEDAGPTPRGANIEPVTTAPAKTTVREALTLAAPATTETLPVADGEAASPASSKPPTVDDPSEMPPYPRFDPNVDLSKAIEEQQQFMTWRWEHTANQTEVILQFRPGLEESPRTLISAAKAAEIGISVGVKLVPNRLADCPDCQIHTFSPEMTQKAVEEELCPKLMVHPDVLNCSPNGAVYTFSIPQDPHYPEQWGFQNGPGAANIEKAWSSTTGAGTTVVAVIDSGIVPHEDIDAGRLLPGYDFVSDVAQANDGNGRDADPLDQGDWLTLAETLSGGPASLRGCQVKAISGWHGTHIAGIIGAIANNGKGIAGVDWATKLLPIRATGKCGGAPGDTASAILWAAGGSVVGVPTNANPARIINMSLTGKGTCPFNVQAAIDEATKLGATVIAAAGNQSIGGSFWPASCKSVLTVVATDEVGKRASFSNFGAGTIVSAPGTNILSTVNPGATTPVAGSAYAYASGTSQATAIVSGVAALMLANNPNLTPFEIQQMIRESAKPFARGSQLFIGDCGLGSCGTGIVDAQRALALSKMGKAVMTIDEAPHAAGTLLTTMPDASIAGWGSSTFGQLGTASVLIDNPTAIPGLSNVDRVFAVSATSWAVLKTGETYAWGRGSFCSHVFADLFADNECQSTPPNRFSFMGNNPNAPNSISPVRVPELDGVKQILGLQNSYDNWAVPSLVALSSSGQVLTWGIDIDGTLGQGTLSHQYAVVPHPTPVAGLPSIKKIAVDGSTLTLALDASGQVWGWGWGDAPVGPGCSFFGNGAIGPAQIPVRIPLLTGVADISVSALSATVLKQDGSVWVYGCTDSGTLTNVQVPLDRGVAVFSSPYIDPALGHGGYAIRSDGSVWRWPFSNPAATTQVVATGALRFIDESPVVYAGHVQMADGHLLALNKLVESSTATAFAADSIGTGSGRLNVASIDSINQVGHTASAADMSVEIASSSVSVLDGQGIDYTITVANFGITVAQNALLTMAVPSNLTVSAIPTGCSLTSFTLACLLGNFASNQNFSITLHTKANSVGTATLAAYVSSDSYDYAQSDDTSAIDVNVEPFQEADVPTLPEWAMVILGLLLLARSTFPHGRLFSMTTWRHFARLRHQPAALTG